MKTHIKVTRFKDSEKWLEDFNDESPHEAYENIKIQEGFEKIQKKSENTRKLKQAKEKLYNKMFKK